MKFQMKLLSLAVMGLALAAPVAHAAIDGGTNSGNGELFFSLWSDYGTVDTANDRSYVRDLGIRINDFSNAATPFALTTQATTAGYTLNFGADATLTTFLSTIPAGANVFWNVVGNEGLGARRFVSTRASSTAVPSIALLPNQFASASRNINFAIASFANNTNLLADGLTASSVAVNSSNIATFGDGAAYAGGVAHGTNLNSRTLFNTTGGIGSQLPFYLQYESSASQSGNALQRQFTSATGAGFDGSAAYWTLGANGDLSYNVNVAAVPEADTWAMFAAGLLAVGAIARRRLAA